MAPFTGSDFFEHPQMFAAYSAYRNKPDIPNDAIEQPIIDEMIGDVAGLNILDLGCGDGRYGRLLLERGARSYFGLDASSHMIEQAKKNIIGVAGKAAQTDLESFAFPEGEYDLVLSRLTFHWIENLDRIFRGAYGALRSSGRFVFSTEHPVVTSCDRARLQRTPYYIVHQYFQNGPRPTKWFGADVIWHHRTIEDFYRTMTDAGFQVDGLRESRPGPEFAANNPRAAMLVNYPLILFMSGRRCDGA